MCSKVYDEVTDFEMWIYQKHKTLNTLKTKHYFSSNKKLIHYTLKTAI